MQRREFFSQCCVLVCFLTQARKKNCGSLNQIFYEDNAEMSPSVC